MEARPYRAKREDNGKWVEGWYLHLNDGLEYELNIIVDMTGQYIRIQPDTLGQRTNHRERGRRICYRVQRRGRRIYRAED